MTIKALSAYIEKATMKLTKQKLECHKLWILSFGITRISIVNHKVHLMLDLLKKNLKKSLKKMIRK